ncbi:MAG: hypothetical protein AB2L14_36440 [Candidatus Xenobiia bacterium LiM19]
MSRKLPAVAGMLWAAAVILLILYRFCQPGPVGALYISFIVFSLAALIVSIVSIVQGAYYLKKGNGEDCPRGGYPFWLAVSSFLISLAGLIAAMVITELPCQSGNPAFRIIYLLWLASTVLSLPLLLFYVISVALKREKRTLSLVTMLIMLLVESFLIFSILSKSSNGRY